jgi:hypothetical protein
MVEERAPKIGSAAGVKKPVDYSTLTKLAADGVVDKVEVGSVPGYRVPKGADSPGTARSKPCRSSLSETTRMPSRLDRVACDGAGRGGRADSQVPPCRRSA